MQIDFREILRFILNFAVSGRHIEVSFMQIGGYPCEPHPPLMRSQPICHWHIDTPKGEGTLKRLYVDSGLPLYTSSGNPSGYHLPPIWESYFSLPSPLGEGGERSESDEVLPKVPSMYVLSLSYQSFHILPKNYPSIDD